MVLKLWLIGVWFVCIFGEKVDFHFAISLWNHNQLNWLLMSNIPFGTKMQALLKKFEGCAKLLSLEEMNW